MGIITQAIWIHNDFCFIDSKTQNISFSMANIMVSEGHGSLHFINHFRLLTTFLFALMHRFPKPGGKDVTEISYLMPGNPKSHTVSWPSTQLWVCVLITNYHLLQEETSLMKVEISTELWIQKCHLDNIIAMFLQQITSRFFFFRILDLSTLRILVT